MSKSYRFGEKLARILAENIYSKDFKGNEEIGMDIISIDVKRVPGKLKRTNIAEVEAIGSLIENKDMGDYVILTPYTNQVSLLKEKISKEDSENRIMTVHGSQGREWDTVIFSVADTSNKWFTDSELYRTNGRKIINTALSRARKRLIVICDRSYWNQESRQLINKIISVSESYDPDDLMSNISFNLDGVESFMIEPNIDNCDNCMLQKSERCFGAKTICEYYQGTPLISNDERSKWPKHGDALSFKFKDNKR